MSDEVQDILKQRKRTHGDFTDHARITQCLKDIINDGLNVRQLRNQSPLGYAHKESLDMIVHKIGRIIAGNPNEQDHWLDIAGYAMLIVNNLQDRQGLKNEPQGTETSIRKQG